jgi:hypothetical protein
LAKKTLIENTDRKSPQLQKSPGHAGALLKNTEYDSYAFFLRFLCTTALLNAFIMAGDNSSQSSSKLIGLFSPLQSLLIVLP